MLRQSESSRRIALIVATSEYHEETLAHLRAPGTDALDLADVLSDPLIGGFEVHTFLDATHDQLMRGLLEVCADARPSDFVLVYLSCHGLMDDRGRLYYATTNTERKLLAATSVSAAWLNDQLEDCRARSQILVLDCCHSGAFAKGAKGDAALALQDRFPGRGKVVLTASRATEYSFEGTEIIGRGITSVFTRAIVDGLKTGEADVNSDGEVTVTDLYSYVFDKVRQMEPRQTPGMWTYGSEGDLLVARSVRRPVVRPAPLPTDILAALESPRPRVRASGVAELVDLLETGSPELSLAAENTLKRLAEEEVPSVAELARAALESVRGDARHDVENPSVVPDARTDGPTALDSHLPTASARDPNTHSQGKERNQHIYRSAREAQANGNWQGAIEGYKLIQNDPNFPDAAALRASCEEQQKIDFLQDKLLLLAEENKWQEVHNVHEELSKLEETASNPSGLADKAQVEFSDRLPVKDKSTSPIPERKSAGIKPGFLALGGASLVTTGLIRALGPWTSDPSTTMSWFFVFLIAAQVLLIAAGLAGQSTVRRRLLWIAVGTDLIVWILDAALVSTAPLVVAITSIHLLSGLSASILSISSRVRIGAAELRGAERWYLSALYFPQSVVWLLPFAGVPTRETIACITLSLVTPGLLFLYTGVRDSRR